MKIWIHAASIGEITSVIPVIKKLSEENLELDFLLTTVTLSSGNLIKKSFSKNNNIQHRYLPIDSNHLVKSFLDGWKPDLIMFVDSEIWPNFLIEIEKRKRAQSERSGLSESMRLLDRIIFHTAN